MALALLSLGVVLPTTAAAEVIHATPGTYEDALRNLAPGDTLSLASGVYSDGLKLHGISGLPGSPVVIEGPGNGEDPALFLAKKGHNTVSMANAAFLTLRNLTLDGRKLPVDAVKAEGTSHFAHHIVLDHLTIRNYDNNQQNVGISTKCPAWAWTIRGNTIDGAGTGIYLGNSDGSAPFIGGVIERNVIRNTIGYNMEIKHQKPRPSVDGMPTVPQETIIRRNTFSKSNGGSTGHLARPNVLVGDFPESGAGQFDRYLIYGNFFYQNSTEALFQGSGRLAVYSNLFVNTTPKGMAIRLTPHKGRLRYFEVFHNTIVATGRGIGAWSAESDGRHWIGANAIFAGRPLDGVYDADWNVTGEVQTAERFLTAPFAPLSRLDLRPRGKGLTDSSVPGGALVDYPGAAMDFAGNQWKSGVAGAYAGPGESLDWTPSEDSAPPLARKSDKRDSSGERQ